MKTKRKHTVWMLGAVALLLVGVVSLFQQRFSAGDVWPAYSSLRADPLGTRLLYESLDAMPDLAVERNRVPLHEAEFSGDTTLLLLGTPRYLLFRPQIAFQSFERFLYDGGRLVIAMRPEQVWDHEDEDEDEEEPEEKEEEENGEQVDVEEDDERAFFYAELMKEWGFSWTNLTVEAMSDPLMTSGSLPWDSFVALVPEHSQWEVLHRIDGEAVMMERLYRKGSIVIMTSSYLFSNEAMVQHRNTSAILNLLGDSLRVVFDESHLGVTQRSSVMMLVYRYRLHAALFCLALLGVLYVWRNGRPLVPPHEDMRIDIEDGREGEDGVSGLVGLMKRHMNYATVLETAVEQFSELSSRPAHQDRVRRMKAALNEAQAANRKNVLEIYTTLNRIANEKRKPHGTHIE